MEHKTSGEVFKPTFIKDSIKNSINLLPRILKIDGKLSFGGENKTQITNWFSMVVVLHEE